jgi:hypothetical protein
MERRDFVKLAAASGLFVAQPGAFISQTRASTEDEYDGPFWITVHAAGGWDPTSFCDPKGRVDELHENPLNMYFVDDIVQVGNLNVAPVEGPQEFFEKYYQDLMVINGLDMATNGHDSGTRNAWSGKLQEGFPSFPALVAGIRAPTMPLSYVSNGGYDYTAGLVAPTRIGNINAITKLAFPNLIDPSNVESTFHTAATYERINQLRLERLTQYRQTQKLPRIQHALGMLHTARTGGNELKLLTEVLPDELDNSGNALKQQAQLAIASYKAGIAVSANLRIGGFDTHGNHDTNQFAALKRYFEGVDYLIEEAERQGVSDKIVILMGSDFGRTPGYNAGNGKDHWSVTSWVLYGQGIPGNKLVGTTDAQHRPIAVDPNTLEPLEEGDRITPAHVHKSLRKLADVHTHEYSAMYPLGVNEMPLFD